MEALTSLIEAALEMFGRRKEREGRTEPPVRVPSLRFETNSGIWETAPVEMVISDHRRYLLAPGSADARWTIALRSGVDCQLVLSDGVHPITVRDLDDCDKPPVLRAYGRRGDHMGRAWRRMDDARLRAIGRDVPVFLVMETGEAST